MKKMFFYASLLLAAATLNSCSQDSDLAADEAATAAAGALTPEQKAQIMELAEYYDLDVTIDDRPVTRGAGQEFNEYTCVQADSGEAMFQKETIKSARPLRLTRMMGEATSGQFTIDENVLGYWMSFTVRWKAGIEEPGYVRVEIDKGSCPYIIERKNFTYTLMGFQPGFVFSADLYVYNSNSYRLYYKLRMTGSYFNGVGSIYVG